MLAIWALQWVTSHLLYPMGCNWPMRPIEDVGTCTVGCPIGLWQFIVKTNWPLDNMFTYFAPQHVNWLFVKLRSVAHVRFFLPNSAWWIEANTWDFKYNSSRENTVHFELFKALVTIKIGTKYGLFETLITSCTYHYRCHKSRYYRAL